jgi:ABC-2 type transport system ATP-binding protein
MLTEDHANRLAELMVQSHIFAVKYDFPREHPRFLGLRAVWKGMKEAAWPLGVPVIIVAGMVGGVDVTNDPEGVKRRIGYMSQRFSLYELLTVDQNIAFFGGLYGLDHARLAERRRFVLEMAGLAGREHTLTRDLAGGWRQRLALGCAILHEPAILFLDEPTGGVDPLSRRQFWRLIDTLSQSGVTVLVTTHYLDEAERCHRVALIHAGRLATIGTTTEVKRVFAGRPILEIRADKAVEAMRLLDGFPEVEKTSLFGTAVHAVLRNVEAPPEAIAERLRHAGVRIDSIDTVPPSLEDVFLDVIDRAGVQGSERAQRVSHASGAGRTGPPRASV